MWPSNVQNRWTYSCLLCVTLARLAYGSRLGPRIPVSYSNSTTSFTNTVSSSSIHSANQVFQSISSETSSSSTHKGTPTATPPPSITTPDLTNTITSAPLYPWGNQSIPINTCSVTATNGEIQWTPCQVFAGTVQLSYFPENSGNLTYPSTYYDPTLSVTLTSPSIYLVINTITGSNDCGPLGPTYTQKVVSMDLTDVYTLQPYANAQASTRMGPPRILSLSDLRSNCPTTATAISTDGAIINKHPNKNAYNRCNPRLVYPLTVKRLGYPYWKHCGNNWFDYGIFDPPGAVPPVDGLLVTAAQAVTSTTEQASPAPTPVSDQATSTSSVTELQTTPTTSNVAAAQSSQSQTDSPFNTPTSEQTTSASVVAVVGTNIISAIPGSSGVILPNGSTASAGSVTTLTDLNSQPVIVSVGSSGIYVEGGDSSTTYYANPTIPAVPIITVGSNVISAAPSATSIIIGSKTAYLNGPAVTIDSSVVQLTTSGVEISDTNSGSINTYAIPNQGAEQDQTPVATIAGQTISAAPGDSTIIINGQTVTSGGPAVTLAGTNQVATLGSDGLIVQYAGGGVSTFAIPTVVPTSEGDAGVVDGMTISAAPGGSPFVIGGQTLTMGGSPITLANNDVLTLGPSGLVVQMPAGGVSTIAISEILSAETTTTGSVNRVASAIASIIGVSSAGTAASVTGGLISPSAISTSSGHNVDSENLHIWIVGCIAICLAFGL